MTATRATEAERRSMEAERRMGETLTELGQRQARMDARLEEMMQAIMAIKLQNEAKIASGDQFQKKKGGVAAMADAESSRVEEEDPIVQLRSLKQVSHIRSYIEAFDELNSKADIEEDQALSLYLSGLVDEFRTPVSMFKPKTLADAYALSKLQELTMTGVLWCDRKERHEEEVDYSTEDSIRNSALETEWKLDSEMEADEEIDLEAEIDAFEEEEADWDDYIEKETDVTTAEIASLFSLEGKCDELSEGGNDGRNVEELMKSHYLPLKRLLVQFPKPNVKMKFMAQRDEELGGKGKVQWASTKTREDQIHVVVLEELGWLFDGDYDASGIDKISEEESGELKEMRHGEGRSGKTYGKRMQHHPSTINTNSSVDKSGNLNSPMSSSVFEDNGWWHCTDKQLEEWLLKNLEFLYSVAINKLVELGYHEEVALNAILRNGHCYGEMDVLTNILHNSLAYLHSGCSNGGDPKPLFADLRQLQEYSLVEMVSFLQQVKPHLTKDEALWCLGNQSSDCPMLVRVWQVSVLDGEVKMKHMVVPVDSCRVFKGGGMVRVTHMQVQHGEVMAGNLGKQLDLDERRLQRIMRGLGADECYGVFKFAEDAAILTLYGFSEPKKEPKAPASSLLLMHNTFDISALEVSDGVLEVLFTSGDTYLGGDNLDKGVADWYAACFKNEERRDLLKDKQALEPLLKMELLALTQSNISMPFITATADDPKHNETTLTRAQFEGVYSDLLDREELVKKLIGSENVLHLESKELMHFVQHASKPFGDDEGISKNLDNLLEAMEGLEWFLASSHEHMIPVVDCFGNATNSDNIIPNRVRLKLAELNQELQLKGASKRPYCRFLCGATSLLVTGKTFTDRDMRVLEQVGKDTRDLLISEIGILVDKKYGGERDEEPFFGDISFDRCFCIDGGVEQLEKLEALFVKVDHLFCYNFQPKPLWILVRIRFWTKSGPWLQSSLIRTFHSGCLHFALFLPTMTCFLSSLRTRKLMGGVLLHE